MKIKIEHILLSIILLSGLVLRLIKINTPLADWHSFRQADTASVSREFVQNGVNLFVPRYHDISRVQSGIFNPNGYRFVEFPVYNAVVAIMTKVFGVFSLELWGRLVSIFLSLLSAIVIFRIGKLLNNQTTGYLSALIFLLTPFNIYFSRVFLPEPMAVFFTCVYLYNFLIFDNKKDVSYLINSGLSISMAVLIKPYTIFFSLPTWIYFLKSYKIGKLIKSSQVWLFSLILFLPFIIWRLWISNFPEGIPFWRWVFNGDGIRFRPAYWYWIYGERIGKLILGVWGVIPLFFGLVSIDKKKYIIYSLVGGVILYLSIIATANVRHDYYQTLIIPVTSLVCAIGIQKIFIIFSDFRNKNFAQISFLMSLVLSFVISFFQIKDFYKINHPEIISAGKAVDRLAPKDAKVIASYNGDTAFLYFTQRKGWPVVELPIEQLISEGAQFYVSVNLDDSQTQDFERRFFVEEKTDEYVVINLIR